MRRQAVDRIIVRALAIVVLALGSLGTAVRYADAQDDLAAAIVRGACDNPGDVAADLRPLALAEGGAQTSFTTIDLAIDELTSGDYAVIVGGSGAPVACGDIAGQGSDVFVAVTARGDAGLGGVAWFHARDDRTQVSLFVSEGLSGTTTTSPTEEPTDQPQPPGDETPAPTRTPKASPTQAAGETETYTSLSYGYTITYRTPLWNVQQDTTEPRDDGPLDIFILRTIDGTQAEFFGVPADPSVTALQHVADLEGKILNDPTLLEAAIRTDADGTPIRGGDERNAYVAIDFTFADDAGNEIKNVYYAECWTMPSVEGFLMLLYQTPQEEYDYWTPARETLELGITLPD